MDDKVIRGVIVMSMVSCVLFMCSAEVKEEEKASVFQVYSESPLSLTKYWERLKALMNQGQAYLFHPNLDFRGRSGDESEGGCGREKIKEAVGKSVGKSKETVEESAKSAVGITEEALKKTKDALLSSHSSEL